MSPSLSGSRRHLLIAVLVGFAVVTVLAGVALAVAVSGRGPGDGPAALAVLVVLVGIGVAGWKLWRAPGGDVEPAPWTETGAVVADPPERVPEDTPITGTSLMGPLERAGRRARNERTVESGLSEVRPMLRQTLVDALVEGGADPNAVRQSLADGTWTDDREAAAVLDERVTPPEWPLRRRFWAWLYPERALRRRVGLATAAVARAADGTLPPVVGQRAPRPVPVSYPAAAELADANDDGQAPQPAAVEADDPFESEPGEPTHRRAERSDSGDSTEDAEERGGGRVTQDVPGWPTSRTGVSGESDRTDGEVRD